MVGELDGIYGGNLAAEELEDEGCDGVANVAVDYLKGVSHVECIVSVLATDVTGNCQDLCGFNFRHHEA